MMVDMLNSGSQGAGSVGQTSNCNLKIHRVVISSDSRVATQAPYNQVESSQTLNSIDLPVTSKSVISQGKNGKVNSSINRAVGATAVNPSPRTP